ncbi:glycosyltransferase [Allorhizobium sp. BGMRC 0089]|uniref:glycosyltransferase family 2 protein n=1 Tax=Allorhizobium sonneratiae TaxID=2934936 RepID=UPI00203369AB|nr:glycosyltransferase [Allorhizobium sonneratiae]
MPSSSVYRELALASRLGIEDDILWQCLHDALVQGTSLEEELLAQGVILPDQYYPALAKMAGLVYLPALPDAHVIDLPFLDSQLLRPSFLRLYQGSKPPLTVIVPQAATFHTLLDRLDHMPHLAERMAVVSPQVLRQAVWRAGAERRIRDTQSHLFDTAPQRSARTVLTGPQGFYIGVCLSLLVIGLLLFPLPILTLAHVLLSLIYLAMLCVRIAALPSRKGPFRSGEALPDMQRLPIYSVLVAVYREKEVIAQLIASLCRLDWPASRLDIKLVCEADDHETLAMIAEIGLPGHFELVLTPHGTPRTKPRALSYALAGVRGDYLVVYDAEDRPHPGQLREAYARFCQAPADVACLQAPLIIANGGKSWISALFALEYAALFRGILPMLARHRLPLPLGGTSNHFRVDPLKAVGGWDPYNVTEDADLGLRFYRAGYRCETMERQTLEDAPTTARVWLGQRCRWFKGWLQTWLVVMRHPRNSLREMGMPAFFMFQLLIGGMLLSSLGHPALLLFFASTICTMMKMKTANLPAGETLLFAIDLINVLGSYVIFIMLGRLAMTGFERKQIGARFCWLPVYWMMTALAAWKAVIELKTRPFYWHKTPHQPRTVIKT